VPSPLRESVERATLPVVVALNRLPRLVPFVLVLVVMVAGIFIPGWGWVLLALLTVFLCWMLFISWPRLLGPERLMRVAVVAMAVAMTVTKALPHA
jgi:hypothetical protein